MRHLIVRGGTYHYRRRVPSDIQDLVGRAFWKQSLKTTSLREAEKKARALGAHYDRGIQVLRELTDIDRLKVRTETLQALQLEKVAIAAREERQGKTINVRKVIQETENERREAQHLYEQAMEAKAPGSVQAQKDLEVLQRAREVEPYRTALLNGLPIPTVPKELVTYVELEKRRIEELPPLSKKIELEDLEDESLLRSRKEQRLRSTLKPIEGTASCPAFKEDPNNPRIQTATAIWFEKKGAR